MEDLKQITDTGNRQVTAVGQEGSDALALVKVKIDVRNAGFFTGDRANSLSVAVTLSRGELAQLTKEFPIS